MIINIYIKGVFHNLLMKTSKLFTLDQDICERLANINASSLVNRLLKDHFAVYSTKNTLLDEKQAVIKNILKKKDRFLKKLRSLKRGMTSTWIIFLRHGSELVSKIQQTLKSLPTLRIEVCRSPQQNLKKPGISTINTEN